VEFERDWGVLQNYAFIKTHPGGTVFTMHRLMQLTAQSWLQSKGKFKMWTGRYMYALHHNYCEWAEKNALIQTAIYPHVRQVGSYRPSNREEIVIWASLMKSAIDYALSHAYAEEALTLSKSAFEIVLEVNGWESQAKLEYSQRHSSALARTGHRDEAEALSRKTCDMRAKILGLQHEDTLASMQTLAKILRGNGKTQEGLALESRTIELYKATQGKGLTGLNEVWPVNFTWDVLSWIQQGKFKEAEERVRALYDAGPAVKRGPGDWDKMAVVMTQQLAMIYTQTERFAEAEALYRQIPYENPEKLLLVARVLEFRGKYQEAEDMYRRVIKDCKGGDALERESKTKDEMVGAMAGLASVLAKCNVVEEPMRLCQQVFEIRKNQEGRHHEQFMAMHTLAVIQERLGAYEDALTTYELAHKGLAAILGEHFLDTKACLKDIVALKEKIVSPEDAEATLARGKAMEAQGNDGEAEALFRRAVVLKLKGDVRYGEPPVAAMESLVQLLLKKGRTEDAEKEELMCCYFRARTLRQEDRFVEALEMCKVAYEGMKKGAGEGHQLTQTIFAVLTEIQTKVTEGYARSLNSEYRHIPGQWED
jgi:tetratricopeptide (TPR) repeat protein